MYISLSLIIIIFILFFLIVGLLIINNMRLLNRIEYLEDKIITNFVSCLILLQQVLFIDAKGYFRNDDVVGINFNLIRDEVIAYMKTLEEMNVNIDDNYFIQEKILDIQYLEGVISELDKEKEVLELQAKLDRKSNAKPPVTGRGKTYIKK